MMFAPTQTYIPIQTSYINRPVCLYPSNNTNKENHNPFTLQKPQNHVQSEPDHNSHHFRPRNAQPLMETRPATADTQTNNYDYAAMFSGMLNNKNIIPKENSSYCRHNCIKRHQRAYCKDCGLFFPKVSLT